MERITILGKYMGDSLPIFESPALPLRHNPRPRVQRGDSRDITQEIMEVQTDCHHPRYLSFQWYISLVGKDYS